MDLTIVILIRLKLECYQFEKTLTDLTMVVIIIRPKLECYQFPSRSKRPCFLPIMKKLILRRNCINTSYVLTTSLPSNQNLRGMAITLPNAHVTEYCSWYKFIFFQHQIKWEGGVIDKLVNNSLQLRCMEHPMHMWVIGQPALSSRKGGSSTATNAISTLIVYAVYSAEKSKWWDPCHRKPEKSHSGELNQLPWGQFR